MSFVVVIIVLIVSFAIEQAKAASWKNDRLKENPDGSDIYTDYFGMDRDRRTNEPRFIGIDISGDRVMYDKNHNIIKNYSKLNEMEKYISQIAKAKEKGQKAIELNVIPSERNKYPVLTRVKHIYRDVYTGANYIVIKGNGNRGMDQAKYYFDYEKRKVIRPTDGFKKRFEDPKHCRVRNTKSCLDNKELSWNDVLDEIKPLQEEIDSEGLDPWLICDYDIYYGYFRERVMY